MRKILRVLCLSFLTTGLLSMCGTPDNYTSFDVKDAPVAYRFQANIPVNDFMTRHLNGYTDPDLRQIIKDALAENPVPALFFNKLVEQANAKGYQFSEYLPQANPELFAGLESNEAICDKLIEIYT